MKIFIILNSINPIITIFFLLYSAEYFGLDVFGEVVFYQTIVTIVAVVLNLQNWSIVYDNQKNLKNYAMQYAYISDLKQNFIGFLIAIPIIIYGYFTTQYFLSILSLLLCVGSFTSMTSELRLLGHITFLSLYRLPCNILRVILFIMLDIEFSLVYFSLLLVMPEVINFLLLVFYKKFILCRHKVEQSKGLKINRAAYKSSLIDLPVNQLDTIVVGIMVSNEGVAIYKIIKSILVAMQLFLRPIIDWLAPDITLNPRKSTVKIHIYTALLGVVIFTFLKQKVIFEKFMKITELSLPSLFFENIIVFVMSIFPLVFVLSLNKYKMYGFNLHNTDVWLIFMANLFYLPLIFVFSIHLEVKGALIALILQMILLNIGRAYFILRHR